jgi:hypothetical protein
MRSSLLALLCVAVLAPTPGPATAQSADSQADCATLVEWMSGSFSSAEQAAADSAYYDIRLEMVRVWPERSDAHWMYIEQAVAGNTDAPYRQRVYRVTQIEEDLFKSEVFTLPDPEEHVGAWASDDPLHELTPDDLELRGGCAVFLRQDALGEFSGGTVGRGCGSELRGAAYATSEVVVGPGRIESWDRGFDSEGNQVWGAEKGPYVFLAHGFPKARGTIPRFDESDERTQDEDDGQK